VALGEASLTPEAIDRSLGALLKYPDDASLALGAI